MIEPEIAFADLFDDMDLAEDMVKYVISHVIEKAPNEMNFLNSFVEKGLLDKLNALINQRVCALHLYRRDRHSDQQRAGLRIPPFPGAATCRPSTSAT